MNRCFTYSCLSYIAWDEIVNIFVVITQVGKPTRAIFIANYFYYDMVTHEYFSTLRFMILIGRL